MSCLYLEQSGSKVSRTGRRLVVSKDDKELLNCPIHHIDRILIFGRIQVTADALTLLLGRNISVCFFNSRGQFRGSLEPNSEDSFNLRKKHYQCTADTDFCLTMSRRIISAKILSARAVLQRYQANHLELKFYRTIGELLELSQKTEQVDNADSLRGLEGTAARMYFEEWRKIFPGPPFSFTGRIRRPPRDPINSLNSFSYVLLTGFLKGLLSAHQLDPWAGFFHSQIRSAPALVLDLLEEFRHPVADRFVFYCIHKNILSIGDFETLLTGAVVLKQKSHKKFITRWENWLHTPQRWQRNRPQISAIDLIHQQVDKLADAIRNAKTYQPFILEA